MGKKKIFKITSLLSVPTLLAATSLVSCSKGGEEIEIKNIVLTADDLNQTVGFNGYWKSSPMKIECFDSNGKKTEAKTKLFLNQENSSTKPDWILLNNSNQIIISGPRDEGEYSFELVAKTEDLLLQSNVIRFKIKILQKEKEKPDKIELNCGERFSVFCPQVKDIPFTVKCVKKGYSPEEIDTLCDCKIEEIIRPEYAQKELEVSSSLTDTDGKITLRANDPSCYAGTYHIKFKVFLKSDPSICSESKNLVLTLINGVEYLDDTTKITYRRNDINSNWSISKINGNKPFIAEAKESIYESLVTNVNSGILDENLKKTFSICYLPKTFTTIGSCAFQDCKVFSLCAMPTVVEANVKSFSNCTNLTFDKNYAIPKFEKVMDSAFEYCKSITKFDLSNIKYIDHKAFYGTNIAQWEIGSNCEVVNYDAFSGIKNLEMIKFTGENPPRVYGPIFDSAVVEKPIYIPQKYFDNYMKEDFFARNAAKIQTY